MTHKVIKQKYLPTKLPVVGTAFWIFLMHYYSAPGWVWGVTGTIFGIVWVSLIIVVAVERGVKPSEVV